MIFGTVKKTQFMTKMINNLMHNTRKLCNEGLADTLNLETFDGVISDDVKL
jgi:hypothetical protein